ncbi:hypothetical protein TNCV_3744041 [Trichonephila clavipes]|nr:hypothetical protein TNCV_3744041 [Trichonephila clavipes]
MRSSPVPLKTCQVGGTMRVKFVEAQMSARSCGVEVGGGMCQLRCRPRHLTLVQNYESVFKSPRVAEQCDVNIHVLGKGSAISGRDVLRLL